MSVPVLMYHNVVAPSALAADVKWPGLYVDPARFDEQMAALRAEGWATVSTREVAEALRTRVAMPHRSIVITLDDGRPNNFTTAAPILEAHGFRATFFVIPGRVGTGAHMTAGEISSLAARGHEIANHTQHHLDLTTVSSATARSEIRSAADAIESMTGTRPVSLAYPYGATNEAVRTAAAAEGVELAFVTDADADAGAGAPAAGWLDLHRIRVEGLRRLAAGTWGGGATSADLLRAIEVSR